ncbi:ABC transporter permease [Ilumatobacter sp.]|uniref:ABC transporter permease n=1 Tax=Ilumatobacter sp. TaxID=1967498 RepID=UPI003B5206AB
MADTAAPVSPMVEAAAAAGGGAPPPPRRRRRPTLFALACGWFVLLVALAALADVLPFVSDFDEIVDAPRQAPSWDHWFGTDRLGRDVFARSIYGARLSLILAGSAVVCGLGIGGTLGLIAGYVRGFADSAISTVVEILLSIPALILALAITSFLGNGAPQVVLALTLLSIAPTARLVRALTLQWSTREFVTAARMSGSNRRQVILSEILPNVAPATLSFTVLGVALLIIAEGALAFLGQSVSLPNPTWGFMIAEGAPNLDDAWWMALLPSAALFITIVSLNTLSDHISKGLSVGPAD